jgi:hypothetical protein
MTVAEAIVPRSSRALEDRLQVALDRASGPVCGA